MFAIPSDFWLDILLFFIPIYFIFLINRVTSISELLKLQGLRKKPIKEILKYTLIIFFFLFSLSYILGFFAQWFGVSDLNLVGQQILKFSPIAIIYLFVIRVFLEEWFFRGFLTPRIGVILSSVLFAAGHLAYGSIIEIIGAFVLGILLAKMYQKTGNLWPNIFAHIIYNLIIYLTLIA